MPAGTHFQETPPNPNPLPTPFTEPLSQVSDRVTSVGNDPLLAVSALSKIIQDAGQATLMANNSYDIKAQGHTDALALLKIIGDNLTSQATPPTLSKSDLDDAFHNFASTIVDKLSLSAGRSPAGHGRQIVRRGDHERLLSTSHSCSRPAQAFSIMHRLLTTRSLLREICSYMSPRELSVLARVSSTWFECAISLLYGRQNFMLPGLLAPLGKLRFEDVPNPAPYTFVTPPTDRNFERFLKYYAPHVRTVSITSPRPVVEAMRMGVSKGVSYLFPNIRSISLTIAWPDSMYEQMLDGLLSSEVDKLKVHHMYNHVRIIPHLCRLAITRLSALRTLIIQVDPRPNIIVPPKPVKELLTYFAHTLTSVHIPLSLQTAPIAECLSKIPNLRNLVIGIPIPDRLLVAGNIWPTMLNTNMNTSQTSEDRFRLGGSFTSLLAFVFGGSCQYLYTMFLSAHNLASLTTFYWNTTLTPADVDTIIPTIVATCPRLRSLTLGEVYLKNPLQHPWPVVPWVSIRPISQCKELTALTINSMHISITLDELTEFLKSRTTWTCLGMFTSNPLRFQDMLLYGKYCPQLEHLGLFVDDCLELESFVQDLPHNIPTFRVLASIDFAYSHITKSSGEHLAKFLFHICKDPPKLIHLYLFDDQVKNRDVLQHLTSLYIDEEYTTGKSMSSKVQALLVEVCRMEDCDEDKGEFSYECSFGDDEQDDYEIDLLLE